MYSISNADLPPSPPPRRYISVSILQRVNYWILYINIFSGRSYNNERKMLSLSPSNRLIPFLLCESSYPLILMGEPKPKLSTPSSSTIVVNIFRWRNWWGCLSKTRRFPDWKRYPWAGAGWHDWWIPDLVAWGTWQGGCDLHRTGGRTGAGCCWCGVC